MRDLPWLFFVAIYRGELIVVTACDTIPYLPSPTEAEKFGKKQRFQLIFCSGLPL